MKTFMRAGVVIALLMFGVLTVSAQDNPQLPVPDDVTDLVTMPGTIAYTTALSADQVVDLYTDYLTSVGFSETMNLFVAGVNQGGTIQFAGPGSRVVQLIVGTDEDGVTGVTVTYTGNFDVAGGVVTIGGGTTTEGSSESSAYVPVETPLNIELVFDASGSMADALGSETRIEAARQTVAYIAESLPDDGNVRVGMRVFGQAGDNSDSGRDESCASTELLVPVESRTDALLNAAADAYEPTGWTPIALALNQAAMDFTPDLAADARNVIILVSDGEETCGGDPAAVAQLLYNSDAQITTHVVTLGATEEFAPVMSAISVNGGGVYINASAGVELSGGVLGLISSEVSNSGGTLVVPATVADALVMQGASGSITISNGHINISGLVETSAGIGQVNIDGSMARLNITVGGSSVDLDGINNEIRIQGEAGSILLSGENGGSITAQGDSATCTLGLTVITCVANPTPAGGG